MDRIAVLPDIRPTGYPAIVKIGYRISGGCRIPVIRPTYDKWYKNFFENLTSFYQNKSFKAHKIEAKGQYIFH